MNILSSSQFSLPQCFTETTSCRQTLGNQAFFLGGGGVYTEQKKEVQCINQLQQTKNCQCQCVPTLINAINYKSKNTYLSILQSKYTNPHSAKIELSCTLCRVNTKSKGKTIQNFYSFCYQTLHLYNKISFILNFLVKVWVSSGETKIQVFK